MNEHFVWPDQNWKANREWLQVAGDTSGQVGEGKKPSKGVHCASNNNGRQTTAHLPEATRRPFVEQGKY